MSAKEVLTEQPSSNLRRISLSSLIRRKCEGGIDGAAFFELAAY